MPVRRFALCVLVTLCLSASEGRAHHEAIFGPQSSLLLTQRAFASLQAFSRRAGAEGQRVQDTTGLLSAGLSPFSFPLSFALAVPVALESEAGHSHAGLEDVLLGVRYRLDLSARDFLMGMAAIELPTGTVHGSAFDRPPSPVGALFASVERGALSAMAFAFGSLRVSDRAGSHEGHELFGGGGLAYTPIDEHELLLSLQLGLSYEHRFRAVEGGQSVADSGGGQLVVSPTVVLGIHERWQLFTLFALPVVQNRRDPGDRDLWRVGAGVVYAFGHEH